MVAQWCCSFYTITAVFPAGDWIFNFLLLFWFDNVCHLVSSTKVLDISLYFLGHVLLKIQKKKKKIEHVQFAGKRAVNDL